MPIKTPSNLPPDSPCPPSILIRGITPPSTSPANGNTSSPLLEFSPPLTTIPLHLWANLSWVPSPISALLGTPLKLARFPAAAAATTSTIVNTNPDKSPPYCPASSGAKTSPVCAEHDAEAGGQQPEVQEEQATEEADGDFQLIAPLLPFFLEIDPEDVATFGKVRLNWLQGTVIVSSAGTPPSFTTTTTAASTAATTTTDGRGAAGADGANTAAIDPAEDGETPSSPPNEPPNQQLLHPRLLAQMVQYLNGPVFRAIKHYRKLDPQSVERRVWAREISERMFCPRPLCCWWISRPGVER
ncbi:hypothetical protein KC336_g15990 [Hortaea werneckii]|nr:hypothetical protein KC336_g15990 [Hortaea werneckii]